MVFQEKGHEHQRRALKAQHGAEHLSGGRKRVLRGPGHLLDPKAQEQARIKTAQQR